jgi:hypothetical protein
MFIPWIQKHASAWISACFIIGATSACSSSLSGDLENRSCTADGQCVDGYVCSRNHICVHPSSATASAGSAADGGKAGLGLETDRDAAIDQLSSMHADGGVAGAAPSNAGAPSSGAVAGSAGVAGASGSSGAAGSSTAGKSSGAAGAAGTAGASGMPAPIAGSAGSMNATACKAGLETCGSVCVDLATNREHCGACDKQCTGTRVCQDSKCVKGKDAAASANDLAGLATLLGLFGLDLSDLAGELGVDESDLDSTPITLTDLENLGIDEFALGLLGIGIDALGLIGIKVSS